MNPAVASRRRDRAAKARLENEDVADNQNSDRIHVNVGEAERQLSMIGGSILAVCGLLRGSLSGFSLAAVGGALIYRGHTGHCALYEAIGHDSAEREARATKKIEISDKLSHVD